MNAQEYVPGTIWLMPYPVSLGGARFEARMTIVRLSNGSLLVHSPGPLDDATRDWMRTLGRVIARAALERILAWDFERVVIAHGELIECDAKAILRRAWRNTLT